ncbi:radical SAM protein [Thermodesulforhabdus norvegica]|uniref:Radical SAM superfamily enzyme YgiQ, UPF0313 family n=1 Tax=Thermodesulforhabdus norvegica TaxID=39841 RepID=A0A1I4SB61_9BACT|nr:radical SAM protein [Thermodesulforhabdus norvegica]SFM61513.1 Radical SAM superfamily enzyme YgiQ, UPF0313 family [Thermodesulforhabdus norvegica]
MLWKLKQTQLEWLKHERGTVKKDWGGKITVALAFPNRYHLGMSNLGYQTVYGLFNVPDDVVCERVFFPEPEDEKILENDQGPLISLESQKPVRDFDFLIFSVPFENDYTNVLKILKWAKIPLRSKERTAEHPLVAMGGVTAFLNPQVLAPFMDFVFVGEAEVFQKTFLDYCRSQPRGKNRREWLLELARSVKGIYVPQFYREEYNSDGTLRTVEPEFKDLPERIPVQKALSDSFTIARSVITTPKTEFSDVTLVEIGRGCGRGCRFCAAGYIYRPPRFHPGDSVVSSVLGRSSRCGLISAAVGDHPDIDLICSALAGENIQVSFSSLRADGLRESIVKALQTGDHHSAAIAPEAGSEKLRRSVNKKINEETIINAVESFVRAQMRSIKLYFMIGLPTETREDVEDIVRLVKKIRHEMMKTARGKGNAGNLVVNVNCFVPKPFTPFQWASFERVEELKERIKILRKGLGKVPNVRFHSDMPKWAYVQALLARGDSRVGDIVAAAVESGWQRAMKQSQWNPDFWVYRERGEREFFPWEIIDHGIRKEFLRSEYERALQGIESPGCNERPSCKICGVCNRYRQGGQ